MLVILKHLHHQGVPSSPQKSHNCPLTGVLLKWVFLCFTEILMFPLNHQDKNQDNAEPFRARSDDNMRPIMFLTPGGNYTPIKATSQQAGRHCHIQWTIIRYRCLSQEGESKDMGWSDVSVWHTGFGVRQVTWDLSVTHRQFCHRSWRARWQRPARHTAGSCSPVWKCRQLSVRTASQCSPLGRARKCTCKTTITFT